MTAKTDFYDTRPPGANEVDAAWLNEVGAKANTSYVLPIGGIPNADMADDAIGIAELSATGTPSASTYLRGDNTWDSPPGSGDASTNTSVSVDSEIALFSGTGGKTVKRATSTGILKASSGVLGTASAGTDYVAPGGALGTPSSGILSGCSGLPLGGLSATGTPTSTTYLCGDGTWKNPDISVIAGIPAVNITSAPYNAVGDGTTDNATAIQAAIDAANTAGVPVYVPPGRFAIGSALTMASGTRIIGGRNTGHGQTEPYNTVSCIQGKAGMNAPLISGPQGVKDVYLENLFLAGNSARTANTYGIWLEPNTVSDEANWYIKNCVIDRATLDGIYVGSYRMAVKIRDCTVLYSLRDGISINTSDCGIDTCLINSERYGILAGGTLVKISNCDIWSCLKGIYVTGYDCCLTDNGIDRNDEEGVYIVGGARNTSIMGCDFHSNSQTTDGAKDHIYVSGTSVDYTAVLIGCKFWSDVTGKDPNYCVTVSDSRAGAVKAYGNMIQPGAMKTAFSATVVNNWSSAGSGDASTNTTTSVDSEVVVFSGTEGKTLKRATGSGLAKLTSGVLGTASAGTDYVAPSALDDVPHYLIWGGSAWPDRPNDDRPAMFVGGSAATDAPDDADLNSGDVWIPATA